MSAAAGRRRAPWRALHWRLLVAVAALVLPLAAALLVVSVRAATRYHLEIVQRQDLELAARLVEDSGLMADGGLDEAMLASLVDTLAMTNPGVEIFVLAPDGALLVDGAKQAPRIDRIEPDFLARFEVARRDPDAARLPLLGPDPSRGGRTAVSTARLPGDQGWLYVVLTDGDRATLARSVRDSTSLRLSGLVAGGVAVALLVLGGVAARLLTRRLRTLQADLRAFRVDGDGPVPAPPARNSDDLDELRADVARLAHRAREQVAALRRAAAERREWVGNLSHDLRTPLAALRGYLEAAGGLGDDLTGAPTGASIGAEGSGRGSDETTLHEHLAGATRAAQRLERLVERLAQLSRLDEGEAALRLEPLAPADLASDVLQKFALRARSAGVELGLDVDGAVPMVHADLELVERALTNLVDNALKHVDAGGRIEVAVAAGDELPSEAAVGAGAEAGTGPAAVRYEVRDDGAGIDPAALPHVFERFVRAEAGRSGEGSGLGLAIVRRVAEIHGGTAWATSDADGTRVGFSLARRSGGERGRSGADVEPGTASRGS